MRVTTAYEATDGSLFKDRLECARHDARRAIVLALREEATPDFVEYLIDNGKALAPIYGSVDVTV